MGSTFPSSRAAPSRRNDGLKPNGSHRSLWLQEALDGSANAPALEGSQRADVAIAGGGFVGLWTAILLKQRSPDCNVVILERDVCGGGASGRNGGFAMSWWPKLSSLIHQCGTNEALRLGRASVSAIDEIGEFCEEHGIDAEFRRGGFLWTATTPAHVGAWEAVVSRCEHLGVHAFERPNPSEVARRTGSAVHLAGVFEARAATIQPARLARGMRRVALELGVRIYENTRVVRFTRDRPLVVQTPHGSLYAEKLVIAMNAWAAALPELRRSIVVVSSEIAATPAIPDRLDEIGWTGGECITDSQMMVSYYRTTADGRIAFGKGTAGVAFAGRVGDAFDRNDHRTKLAELDFRRYYPVLSDVPLEHRWGGPIDRTPNSLPIFGHLGGREHILYGVGWSGNGVGPSVLGGKILSSLALGAEDEWSTTALVDGVQGRFPPEPARFVGAQIVRQAVIRKERAEAAGRKPRRLARLVAKLAPAGLEDKE